MSTTTGSPTITIADVQRVAIATGNENITLLQVATFLENERTENERKYVQIRFPNGGRRYTYQCEGCQVGDYVVVPANTYSSAPQTVRVVGLGRDTTCWSGPVKSALRVPDDFVRVLR